MRHSTILLSILVLSLFPVKAQDYQSVLSDRIYYYLKSNGEIEAMDVDSTHFEGDSIFYFSSRIRNFDDCFSPYGPSWFGNKLVIKANGDNCFLNRNEDTILIRTQGNIGDIWTVYHENSLIIRGKVTDIDTMSFLNLTDTVKSIRFSALDEDLIPVDHSINDMTILLSKNYGLIQTLNFSLFPSFIESLVYDYCELEMWQLIGISQPEIGIQNLEWNDIYDFQLGDEIHTIHEYYRTFPYTKTQEKITYLSRTDKTDRINYIVSIEKIVNVGIVSEFSWGWGPPDFIDAYIDTLTYYADSSLSPMPWEPIIEKSEYGWDLNEAWAYKFLKFGELIIKTKPDILNSFFLFSDSCWDLWGGEVWVSGDMHYIKGGGGPYFKQYETGDAPYLAESVNLIYLKKTDFTWGTPLDFSSIQTLPSELLVYVVPNPAQEFILIKIPDQYLPSIIVLYDMTGKMVFNEIILASNWHIDLGANLKGLYFYKIMNDGNTLAGGQLHIK
jgi:hypothetical protein